MLQDNRTDETLFAAYRDGDMAAFDVLYARYRQPVFLFLLRRGHIRAAAEDLFHDCWMRVVDDRQRFDGGHFRGWIFSIARNLSIDLMRRSNLRDAADVDPATELADPVSTERQQEAEDCVELIKHSIGLLPIEQRDAFLLKQEADLSLQQIAELMAVGRETIKSRLRYAMQQLKQLMAECL